MLKPMYFPFPTYYLLIVVLCGATMFGLFFPIIAKGLMAFSFLQLLVFSPPSTNTFITFVSNPIYPMFRYPINNTQLVFTYST